MIGTFESWSFISYENKNPFQHSSREDLDIRHSEYWQVNFIVCLRGASAIK